MSETEKARKLRDDVRIESVFVAHQHDDMIVLDECPVLFMDGTFKAAPNMCSQLFTIHGLYHDHVVSLV